MAIVTLILGGVLILLGFGGYFGSGAASKTALIPAAFGLVFDLLGSIALVAPKARKHLMHAAVVVAVLGIAGTFPGLMKLPTLLSGGQLERPAAVAAQSAMAGLCVVYLLLAVNSFIAARRNAGTTKTD